MAKHDDETAAVRLESTGDYRVLRRLRLETWNFEIREEVGAAPQIPLFDDAVGQQASQPNAGAVVLDLARFGRWRRAENGRDPRLTEEPDAAPPMAPLMDENALLGAAIDIETTGLDPKRHRIIEIAIRVFRFDVYGRITSIGPIHNWLEDPRTELDPTIVRLTGLHDADLAGQAFDEAALYDLVGSVDVLVSHHAGFDRKFVEKRFAGLRGRAWACTLREIDWSARGLNGGSLAWLLAQAGYFHDAHRAGADVDALLALLGHRAETGETALFELLDRASRSTWLISAIGAPFAVKDDLKERGYRWNALETVWQREVMFSERAAEEEWLRLNVYDPVLRPKAPSPRIAERDWTSRYA